MPMCEIEKMNEINDIIISLQARFAINVLIVSALFNLHQINLIETKPAEKQLIRELIEDHESIASIVSKSLNDTNLLPHLKEVNSSNKKKNNLQK